ncbi:MAG TPA: hypothetical protein VM123_03390 [archaeon]|nr:hypothetical protein [archaeon]
MDIDLFIKLRIYKDMFVTLHTLFDIHIKRIVAFLLPAFYPSTLSGRTGSHNLIMPESISQNIRKAIISDSGMEDPLVMWLVTRFSPEII